MSSSQSDMGFTQKFPKYHLPISSFDGSYVFLSPVFKSAVASSGWLLWLNRNDRIFNRDDSNPISIALRATELPKDFSEFGLAWRKVPAALVALLQDLRCLFVGFPLTRMY